MCASAQCVKKRQDTPADRHSRPQAKKNTFTRNVEGIFQMNVSDYFFIMSKN